MKKVWIMLFLALFIFNGHSVFAQMPEVTNGINYLRANQNADGSWGNISSKAADVPTTREVLAAFHDVGVVDNPYQNGLGWLAMQFPITTEGISSRIISLYPASTDPNQLLAMIDDMRKAWGGYDGYDVNILDTSMALQAMNRTDSTGISSTAYALNFLLTNQNSDGGWGFTDSTESAIYYTALAVITLQEYATKYNLAVSIDGALQYLLYEQNPDGGFGLPSSTVYETALAILALNPAYVDSQEMNNALLYLQTTQSTDGAWQQDMFDTALAIRALHADFKAHEPPPPPVLAAIKGRVVNAGGAPLAGVSAKLSGAGGQFLTLGADGVFYFPELAEGNYTIILSLAGYQERTVSVSVAAGQIFDFGNLFLADIVVPVTAVEGIVTEAASGLPLTGATVSISGANTKSMLTDSNGAYNFGDLLPGGVVIQVSKDGYQSIVASAPIALGQTLLFSPALSQEVVTPPSPVTDNAGLTGQIIEDNTGQPLSGAEVTITINAETTTTWSDAAGFFTFTGLAPDTAFVECSLAGYQPLSFTLGLQADMVIDIGQLKMLPAGTVALLSDLVVDAVDMSDVVNDSVTLSISGNAAITMKNAGSGPAMPYLEIAAFYDANKNKVFDIGVDLLLGQARNSTELAPQDSETVQLSLQGYLPYRDAPVTFWVDSLQSEIESDEGNNIFSSTAGCNIQPVVGTFDPVIKFHALDGIKISSTPMVANLTDDNGDGLIDENDIPDLAVVDHAGLIHVISGDDGREIFVTSPSYPARLYNEIAIGDIDGDNFPELLVAHDNARQLIAFEHTGELKWLSDEHPMPATVYLSGVVSIADLDVDGAPEIVVGGAIIFDSTGAFIADGRDIGGTMGFNFATAISSIADINLDGVPEIIAGPTAYQFSNGQLSILWQRTDVTDGFSGIGNFDEDEYAEIIIVGGGRVYMLNHDGTDAEVWNQPTLGYVNIPGGGHGGAPTIADFDGDNVSEIGVAGANYYVVFEKDGSVRWTAKTIDASSSITGSTSFDFEGDGAAEIIYRDERNLHIFNGADGVEIFTWSLGSGTGVEMPIVADIDNDGHAEIAVSSDSDGTGLSEHTGIYVFEDANDSWMPTRTIWNQHSYHITNINDDGTFPVVEQNSWLTHNTYRLNTFMERDPLSMPDLSIAGLNLSEIGSGYFSLSVLIGNGGSAPSPATTVSFYEGIPLSGGVLLGTVLAPALEADSSQTVTLNGVSGITGMEKIYAVVDADNIVDECNEGNNSVSIPAPGLKADLVIPSLNTLGIATDLQTLEVSGILSVEVSNQGSLGTFALVDLLAYYDANNSSAYESGVDVLLGEGRTASTLDAGITETVILSISGVLPYRDAPITVWVDSGEDVVEIDETNNIRSSAQKCSVLPVPAGQLDPVEKWHWSGSANYPAYKQIMSTPVIAQLNDDNGDGRIDTTDIPDVIFTTFAGSAYNALGVLRAVSGSDGSEVWNYAYVGASRGPAVGDIDHDGLVEIIISGGPGVIALENDGSLKWTAAGAIAGHPAIADLNHDGDVEIICGRGVYDPAGALLWSFTGNDIAPLVADVNLDGFMEIFAYGKLYDKDGSVLWDSGVGYTGAIGNFDDDEYPEIAVNSGSSIKLLEHDGQVKWGPVAVPGGGGGPVTVADVDADGDPEVGVAGAHNYFVIETNGMPKWQSSTRDYSSRVTGSSVFDFEGDGRAEILYNDELNFRIYDGETGNILFQTPNPSGTLWEYPLVVDIDNDKHAEIVLIANNYAFSGVNGIRVFESMNDNWMPTRSIWNQHTYHITNINDDGTIPQNEEPSWLTHNTYRLNTFADHNPLDIPDLSTAMLRFSDNGRGVFDLTARVGNGGTLSLTDNIAVGFYEGDPAAGGRLLGSVDLSGLAANAFTDVTLEQVTGITGTADIYAVVDFNGEIDECDEFNNIVRAAAPQVWADLEASDLQVIDNGADNPLTAEFMISNIGAVTSPDQTLVAFYNGDPLAGGVLLATMNIAPVAPGEDFPVVFAGLSGIDSGATLYAVVDADDRVQEYSECNNITEQVMPASEQGMLALATDQPLYGANKDVLITASLTNTGALSGEFTVRLRIEDSGGILVDEPAPISAGVIAGAEVVAVNAVWNTGTYLAGGYRIRGYLDSATAQDIYEITTPFTIGSTDPQTPAASLRTTTDKTAYDPGETVVIHNLFSNQSSNLILDDAVLTVDVSGQGGVLLFSETIPVNRLIPGMHKDLISLFALGATPAGQYTVTGKTSLVADDTVLAEDSAVIEVRSTSGTGSGLTGYINADDQVYMGRELDIGYGVTNNGNEAINEMTVQILIIDPVTDQLFLTLEDIVATGRGMTYDGALAADTSQLAPNVYMAVLMVSTPQMVKPKTLGSVNFEVLPSLAAEITATDSVSLLVWVNDGCDDRHVDDDEHHDDSGDDHCEEQDNEPDHEKHEETSCDDHHDIDHDDDGDNECASLDLIESIFADITDYHLIVRDLEDFEREMRNPLFTDVMILGDKHKLTDQYDHELKEMIYTGTGLIASLWSEHDFGEDVLGLEIEGGYSIAHGAGLTVETIDSPVSLMGSIAVSGRINRLEDVHEGRIAGWISSDECSEDGDHDNDHDGSDNDDNSEDEQHAGETGKCPAMVFNDYGEGGSVYLAFDLLTSLDLTSRDQFEDLLASALSYIHRPMAEGSYDPYQVVPISTRLKSLGGAFDVRLTDTFSPGLSLFDPVLGSWVIDNPRITDIYIDADQTLDIKTFALLPDQPGDYSIETEVGFVFGSEYSFFDSLNHDFTVPGSVTGLVDAVLAGLDNLNLQESRFRKVKEHLIEIRNRLIVDRNDIEKNIHDIEKVIDTLTDHDHDNGFDIAGIRLMLARLHRIEQGRWYFHVQ